ncbi:MAG: DNA alkylation repair protein [Desulfurellaceae bacterium]|nr:DNA alkylation repair protein [Desulfurellaceae bacterium]
MARLRTQASVPALSSVAELLAFVSGQLGLHADPAKAGPMAAYMKTDMPFYGVAKPERDRIATAIKDRFPITDHDTYERAVTGLWALSHREEKYLAIRMARLYADYVTPRSLALYKRLIQDGAWWDCVDEIAIHLVGRVLYHHRPTVSPILDAWINNQDMWLRRAALLSQIHHKGDTDEERLFGYCLQTADETAFFIRKAIGWALRDYSATAPERVLTFLQHNRGRLSGLSFREAARRLRRQGYSL